MTRTTSSRFVRGLALALAGSNFGCGNARSDDESDPGPKWNVEIGGEWMDPSSHRRILVTDDDWTRFGVETGATPYDERVLILEFDNTLDEAVVTAAPEFGAQGYWKRWWVGPLSQRFGDQDYPSVCPFDIALELDELCYGFFYCAAETHADTIEEARLQSPPMKEVTLDLSCWGHAWAAVSRPYP